MVKLWEARKVGHPQAFNSPIELWNKAVEYFEWCEVSKLECEKVFCSQGVITTANEPKTRAMTIQGLCLFLNISTKTYYNYKERDEYSEVVEAIADIIYEHKFTGAAAGIFSANIITRDLGLKDRQETEITGESITPWSMIIAGTDDPKEASEAYMQMIKE